MEGGTLMFIVRPYQEKDAAACGQCFFEGFFTGPTDGNDRAFLRDYAQVLIEKCSFSYVAVASDGQVGGFVCGKYNKSFDKRLAGRSDTERHYGRWLAMFLKFYLKGYKLSPAFQAQFDAFFRQLRQREEEPFQGCDLELVALSSRKAYRKGVGTALVTRFISRAQADGAGSIRLLTNTLASWEFYEKRGFCIIWEKPFPDSSGERTMVYEYRGKER